MQRVRVVFVTTDVAASNIEALRKRAELGYFVDQGLLDFAVFDCNKDTTIHLLHAGVTIGHGEGGEASAVCLIANYIFDSLVSDTFRVAKGDFSFLSFRDPLSIYLSVSLYTRASLLPLRPAAGRPMPHRIGE